MGRRKKETVPEETIATASLEDRLSHLYCYVCGKKIQPKEKSRYIGNGLSRHTDCEPGSKNWMESDQAVLPKSLPFTALFEAGEKAKEEKRIERQRYKDSLNLFADEDDS